MPVGFYHWCPLLLCHCLAWEVDFAYFGGLIGSSALKHVLLELEQKKRKHRSAFAFLGCG